jgi:hypothetical protein
MQPPPIRAFAASPEVRTPLATQNGHKDGPRPVVAARNTRITIGNDNLTHPRFDCGNSLRRTVRVRRSRSISNHRKWSRTPLRNDYPHSPDREWGLQRNRLRAHAHSFVKIPFGHKGSDRVPAFLVALPTARRRQSSGNACLEGQDVLGHQLPHAVQQ